MLDCRADASDIVSMTATKADLGRRDRCLNPIWSGHELSGERQTDTPTRLNALIDWLVSRFCRCIDKHLYHINTRQPVRYSLQLDTNLTNYQNVSRNPTHSSKTPRSIRAKFPCISKHSPIVRHNNLYSRLKCNTHIRRWRYSRTYTQQRLTHRSTINIRGCRKGDQS